MEFYFVILTIVIVLFGSPTNWKCFECCIVMFSFFVASVFVHLFVYFQVHLIDNYAYFAKENYPNIRITNYKLWLIYLCNLYAILLLFSILFIIVLSGIICVFMAMNKFFSSSLHFKSLHSNSIAKLKITFCCCIWIIYYWLGTTKCC